MPLVGVRVHKSKFIQGWMGWCSNAGLDIMEDYYVKVDQSFVETELKDSRNFIAQRWTRYEDLLTLPVATVGDRFKDRLCAAKGTI